MQRLTVEDAHAEKLFGTRDENLRYLEERLGVTVNARGGEISLSGPDEASEAIAAELFKAFDRLLAAGGIIGKEEFKTGVRVLEEDATVDLVEFFLDASISPALKRLVVPRNLNQRLFIRSVGFPRLRVRRRPRRHRQDLPRGGPGGGGPQ
jgi:phosphate starvation-inducible protein PhoH and related proteins